MYICRDYSFLKPFSLCLAGSAGGWFGSSHRSKLEVTSHRTGEKDQITSITLYASTCLPNQYPGERDLTWPRWGFRPWGGSPPKVSVWGLTGTQPNMVAEQCRKAKLQLLADL